MGYVLKGIDHTMCHVVSGINTPRVTSMRMSLVLNTVCCRITETWVVVLHVNLHSQTALSFLKLTILHVIEQLEILLN